VTPLITFFVLTYAIAWGFLPIEAVRFEAGAPPVAALIVIPLTQGIAVLKELGLRMIRWRVRWYWYVVAIRLPLAVVTVAAELNVALGASTPSLDLLRGSPDSCGRWTRSVRGLRIHSYKEWRTRS
jgi:uncharacterized protein